MSASRCSLVLGPARPLPPLPFLLLLLLLLLLASASAGAGAAAAAAGGDDSSKASVSSTVLQPQHTSTQPRSTASVVQANSPWAARQGLLLPQGSFSGGWLRLAAVCCQSTCMYGLLTAIPNQAIADPTTRARQAVAAM